MGPSTKFRLLTLLSAGAFLPGLACHRETGTTQLTAATTTAPARAPIPDADIAQAFTRHLKEDSAVRNAPVQVDVKDGICTLSGTVGNLLAKDRTLRIAESLKGVRSVIDRVDVQPVTRTDDQLQRDVSRALESDPATRKQTVDVIAKHGQVTLSGGVASWPEKMLFTDAAKGVQGVKSVENRIHVTSPFVRQPSEIASDVKQRLANDIWLDGNVINVSVAGHDVTLKGLVGSVAEKSRARADAYLAGVDNVDDTALVVDWAKRDDQRGVVGYALRSDDDIASAIRAAFALDPRVAANQPQVAVKGGIVDLTGTLPNEKAKRAAELDAKDTVGVYDVHDQEIVLPTDRANDIDIEHGIKRALIGDLLLEDSAAVHASTSKGKVTLTGDVESGLERFDVVADVASVPGVTDIVDNMSVKRSPKELESDIADRLLWDASVQRDRVKIAVDGDGVATLSGTLDSASEIRAAVADAMSSGAKRVINTLQLTKTPEK